VHEAVGRLIERLPANMRVVIASRCDPPVGVSKWRARGEMAELRFGDLAFTEEETAELANSCLRLSLSPEELRALHAGAEGWAAGLRLLATWTADASPGEHTVLGRRAEGRQRVFEF
jgi:LuxR family maltose regulon positive regulatory protein